MKKKFDFFPAPDGLSGRVVFYFDKQEGGRKIDTGWLKSGLKESKAETIFPADAGSLMLVTALRSADEKLYFGAAGLFDEVPSFLGKVKIASAIDEQKRKIRFAVKLKGAETEKVTLVYRIIDQAVPSPTILAAEKAAPAPMVSVSSDSLVGSTASEEDSFYIENPPSAIHCNWKYTLRAHIPAVMNGKVKWEIGEEGAGTIDQNGQYTAPAKPGAYEVIARFLPAESSEGNESAEASVYLIVL